MHQKLSLLCATVLALATSITPARADKGDAWSKDRFMVRVRAIDLAPDESSSVNIGGHVNVTNKVAPEVDLTYFFTDHIAAEVIAATTKHSLSHSSGAELGSTWVLPPTVTLQYHFMPEETFSPYVGAGLNYSIFYHENSSSAFTGLKIDNGIGYALQAGADYWLGRNWGVNLDVKKIFLNVDASLNNGAVRADVDLDPWVVGAGVSYRF